MLMKATGLGVMVLLLQFAAWAGAATTNSLSVPGDGKIQWRHPAGYITEETLSEIKTKLAGQEWARQLYNNRRKQLEAWLSISSQKLREVFPKKRGNVYHNFSCPQDRCRLVFEAFNPHEFKCPICDKHFSPETNAGIYTASDRYHSTMYEGWICLFHLEASTVAGDLAVFSRTETQDREKYAARCIDILMLYAEVLENIPTKVDPNPQLSVLLTYHREGDNKILEGLAVAYELVRDGMSPEQRSRFEQAVLERVLKDIMLERIYTYDHNNVYQWHRTIIQTALALEREELIDWSFGFGKWDSVHEPEHRSVQKILATHFKPDGAFWEMCSGYHLYPLNALCELAVISRNLSRMDSIRFPKDRYDLTAVGNPNYRVIENSLQWFMSLAPPSRIMPTIGDSMAPRAGMADYFATAETGYRFYGLKAVGDYPQMRAGQRNWAALLYGAPQIVESPEPYTSSHLSSGWVSLRNEWRGNRAWVGLNALIPGGGHQHADRLTLLTHSQGELLAWEKATPYNESTTRILGTLSPSHNTVTVDMQSQKQGEQLKGEEIPKIAFFVTSPIAQFAELRADSIYSQTGVYRRSVALIEDLYVDFFRVEGGTNHDWMFHHAGAAPELSLPLKEGSFVPANWLAASNGTVRHAEASGPWEAKWSVAGVTSRLTMLGANPASVYTLETYPVDNAFVTPRNPACQTLCVRRSGGKSEFLAVGDAWRETPNLQSVSAQGGRGLLVKTKAHTYHVLFMPGQAEFSDGVLIKSDAAFAVLRDRDALMVVHGSNVEVQAGASSLIVRTDKPASISAEFGNGSVKHEVSGDIQYDTYGGRNHFRPKPDVAVTITGKL